MGFRHLDEYVRPAIMGEAGTDIKLSLPGKEFIPFDIECKNVERLNLWSAWGQAVRNTEKGRHPLLVVTKNRSPVLAVVEFEFLMELLTHYQNSLFAKQESPGDHSTDFTTKLTKGGLFPWCG